MTRSLIVVNQLDGMSNKDEKVICWQSYQNGKNVTSLPAYMEKHGKRLRGKYVAFVHELGEYVIGGKSLIEHMRLSDDFSIWWMSHIAEKSPLKSPQIYDCLRILALEELLLEKKPSSLHLINSNKSVVKSISHLCKQLNIEFSHRKDGKHASKPLMDRLYSFVPYGLQGLISLRHLVIRWPLRRLPKPQWFSGEGSIFMCSYFYHLDTEAGERGEFYSRQWEGLPKFLRDNGLQLNWIHHFLSSPGMPKLNKSVNWLKRFNKHSVVHGNHAFIETYLTFEIALRVIKHWVKLNSRSFKLLGIRKAFKVQGSAVNLWPLLKHDWKIALTGSNATSNCLWYELFNSALRDMPCQKNGLFLWENQGWEVALVHAWKQNGHGKIIGVPHATTRFWALNNFDDIRTLKSTNVLSKVLPDYLAINGQQAWDEFVDTNYPSERLIQVEALRYQYLLSALPINTTKAHRRSPVLSDGEAETINMLVIGDFSIKQTYKMLKCIESAQRLVGKNIRVTLKSHPLCQIEQRKFHNLKFQLVNKPLDHIMYDFDVAFASNGTSGGIDVFLAGVPTVIFIDDETFNQSPLRGVSGVTFAANATELSLALNNNSIEFYRRPVSDFFWLDYQLSRWRNVLLTNKESS